MSTIASHKEQTVDILRLLRSDLAMSQTERVNELLQVKDAQRVIDENSRTLFASQATEEEDLNFWLDSGYNTVNVLEDDYPRLLREVREAPGILYWQGTLHPDEAGVSLVGSRSATPEALDATRSLATMLAVAGIPVISGLAKGIDTAAHTGALEAGGRTIAVMGTGLEKTYPSENQSLRESIQEHYGLIISQFEPYSKTHKFNFPMRNAVMSGYGLATIVMAASENSGTKHQVQAAVKHGRKVIFTGKVANTVSWAHKLVKQDKALSVGSLQDAVRAVMGIIEEQNSQAALF